MKETRGIFNPMIEQANNILGEKYKNIVLLISERNEEIKAGKCKTYFTISGLNNALRTKYGFGLYSKTWRFVKTLEKRKLLKTFYEGRVCYVRFATPKEIIEWVFTKETLNIIPKKELHEVIDILYN